MAPARPILTLGYGRRSVDELIRLLREAGITVLVDVRSAPYSKRRPELAKRAMEVWLPEMGVEYAFLGDRLGGRPEDPAAYVKDQLVPDRRWRHPDFRAGLDRLLRMTDGGALPCLLCAEEDPTRCHRFHLVGEALHRERVPVSHLLADGTIATHAEIREELDGPQLSLF